MGRLFDGGEGGTLFNTEFQDRYIPALLTGDNPKRALDDAERITSARQFERSIAEQQDRDMEAELMRQYRINPSKILYNPETNVFTDPEKGVIYKRGQYLDALNARHREEDQVQEKYGLSRADFQRIERLKTLETKPRTDWSRAEWDEARQLESQIGTKHDQYIKWKVAQKGSQRGVLGTIGNLLTNGNIFTSDLDQAWHQTNRRRTNESWLTRGADKSYAEINDAGKKGIWDAITEIADNPTKMAPFLHSLPYYETEVRNAAYRVSTRNTWAQNKFEAGSPYRKDAYLIFAKGNPEKAEQLYQRDRKILEAYRKRMDADVIRGSSIFYDATKTLVDMLPYGLEIAATSGATGIASKGIAKGVTATLPKALNAAKAYRWIKPAAEIAGGTVINTPNILNMAAGLSAAEWNRQAVKHDEAGNWYVDTTGIDSAAIERNALIQSTAEIASEFSGAFLGKAMRTTKLGRLESLLAKKYIPSGMRKVAKMIRFNGTLEEVGEEWINNLAVYAAAAENLDAESPDDFATRMEKFVHDSAGQTPAMLLSFAVMPAMGMAINGAQTLKERRRATDNYKKLHDAIREAFGVNEMEDLRRLRDVARDADLRRFRDEVQGTFRTGRGLDIEGGRRDGEPIPVSEETMRRAEAERMAREAENAETPTDTDGHGPAQTDAGTEVMSGAADAGTGEEAAPEGVPMAEANLPRTDTENTEKTEKTESAGPEVMGGAANGGRTGAERVIRTPDGGMEVKTRFKVIALSDVIHSGKKEYDQRFQPRNRDTKSSAAQVEKIGKDLHPDLLLDSAQTDTGAPIVDAKNQVISGNGRIMGILRASDGKGLQDYYAAVRKFAAENGIEIPEGMRNPLLVREVVGDADLVKLAELSNRDNKLRRSDAEQAEADAKTILDGDLLKHFKTNDSGEINTEGNANFLSKFIAATGDESLRNSDGSFSDMTEHRVRRALLAALFSDQKDGRQLIQNLVENAREDRLKTQVAGVIAAAGHIMKQAQRKGYEQYDLSNDLAQAFRNLIEYKRENKDGRYKSIDDYLNQGDMFKSEERQIVEMLTRFLENSKATEIRDALQRYAEIVKRTDVHTDSLFGDPDERKIQILNRVLKKEDGAEQKNYRTYKEYVDSKKKAEAEKKAAAKEKTTDYTDNTEGRKAEGGTGNANHETNGANGKSAEGEVTERGSGVARTPRNTKNTENTTEARTTRDGELSKDGGDDWIAVVTEGLKPKYPTNTPRLKKAPRTAEQDRVRELLKEVLGIDVEFYVSDDRHAPDGIRNQWYPGKIFLKANGEFMFTTAWHEFFHSIRGTETAKKIAAILRNHLDAAAYERWKEYYKKVLGYSNIDISQYSEDALWEEFCSDSLGMLSARSSFWDELKEKEPGILQMFMKFLEDLIDMIVQNRHFDQTKRVITQLEEAEKQIAGVLREARAAGAEARTTGNTTNTKNATEARTTGDGELPKIGKVWEKNGLKRLYINRKDLSALGLDPELAKYKPFVDLNDPDFRFASKNDGAFSAEAVRKIREAARGENGARTGGNDSEARTPMNTGNTKNTTEARNTSDGELPGKAETAEELFRKSKTMNGKIKVLLDLPDGEHSINGIRFSKKDNVFDYEGNKLSARDMQLVLQAAEKEKTTDNTDNARTTGNTRNTGNTTEARTTQDGELPKKADAGRFNQGSETPLLSDAEDAGDFQLFAETPKEAAKRDQAAEKAEADKLERAKEEARRKAPELPMETTDHADNTERTQSGNRSAGEKDTNKIFTRERMEEARKKIHEILNRMNMGFDPELLTAGIAYSGYYVEKGVRKFADFAKEMTREFGEKIRPYLRSLYEAVRRYPGMEEIAKEMSGEKEIEEFSNSSKEDLKKEKSGDKVTENKETGNEQRVDDGGLFGQSISDGAPAISGGISERKSAGNDRSGNDTAASETNGKNHSGRVESLFEQPDGAAGNDDERGDRRRGPVGTERVDAGGNRPGPEVVGEDVSGRNESAVPVKSKVPEKKKVLREEEKNHRIGKDDVLIAGGDASKIKANIEALKLLKKLEKENRNATPEEKKVLAKYVGWGGLPKVFEYGHPQFFELRKLLTRDEWDSAMESTINAHYTERGVIEKMWSLASELGFEGGKVGEFGAGIGHFLGLVSDKLADKTKFRAVELDSVTGRMLTKLYPQAEVTVAGLEKTKIANNSLSMVIGNFPFAKDGPYDDNYPRFSLHNYFFARAIDAVKPGGLVIALTSNSTMDNAASLKAREWIAAKADLIGAIRLPNNAFRKNAGTDVVTDILVFRKKDGASIAREDFGHTLPVECKDGSGTAEINEYYVKHPEMVLGENSMTGSMYRGASYTVNPTANGDLQIELGKAVRELAKKGKVFGSQKESEALVVIPDDGTHKFGEFHVKDGKLYQQGKDGAEEVKGLSSNDHKRILAFLALKQRYNDVMKGMLDEVPDMTLGLLQSKLKGAYNAFVNSFGNIANSRKQLILRTDPSYIRVSGLERVESKTVDGKNVFEYKPSAVFTERTIRKNAAPKTAGSLEDAAQISLNYRGAIVPEYVAQLVGMPVADAKANLLASGKFFENPDNGQLETAEKYLSGNIAEKLKAAKEAAKQDHDFQANVLALEKAMPLPKKIADIGFKLGTTWVPADVVRRWLQEDLGARRVNVTYSREIDQWFADGDFYSVSGYSAGNKDAKDILLAALNLKRLKVFYKVHDKTVFDREATEAANALKNQMSERFVNFVKKNPELAKAVEDEFNTKINIYVNRDYSGTGKDGVYPGAAETINGKPVRMREHQRAVIARAIEGNTLIAHCVGAGKTFSMITIAEELKRLKLANKNLIVVQNATVEQFAQSARDLYPNAAILSVTKRDMEAKNRKRFMMMIANNDWDIIVMPQSQFNMLVDRPEIQQQYMQSKIDNLRDIIEELKNDRGSRNTVKEIARQMKSLESKLEHKLGKKKNAEDVVYFDELGIDALFIDEAHAYKKNFFVTKMPQMKGLDRSDSERAMGLTLKINQIMQKTGGRNIYLATGTPITNTLAEAWNMVRYLYQEGEMPFDCNTFDRFASMFTETVSDVEQTAAGNYKSVERFVKFTNLDDLHKFFTSVADVVLPEDLKGVKRPPIKGGAPTNMIVPRGEVITNFMRYLNDLYSWYDGLSGQEKKKYTAMNLQIYTMARKASIDMRLIDASLPDDPNSKLSKCAEMVYQKWKEYAGVKGTQAVFFDLHRNVDANKQEVFNAYDELKRKLVEYGIPAEEIAHMDNFTTDVKKAQLFEDVNAGRVRVIIGGTQTLGTGVNIQERLACIHHVDVPQLPSDMEQRNGRGIRQGNTMEEVEIFQYAVDRTLDASSYQMLARKDKFIKDVMKGRIGGEAAEESGDQVSYEEFAAEISGNQDAKRFVTVKKELSRLKALRNAHAADVRSSAEKLRQERQILPQMEECKKALDQHLKEFEAFDTQNLTVDGKKVKRAEFATALDKFMESHKGSIKKVFTINGIPILVERYWADLANEMVQSYAIDIPELKFGLIKYGGQFTSGSGFMQSLTDTIKKKSVEAERMVGEIAHEKKQIERLQEAAESKFDQEDELNNLEAEHLALAQKLTGEQKKWDGPRPSLSDYVNAQVEIEDAIIEEEAGDDVKLSPGDIGEATTEDPDANIREAAKQKIRDLWNSDELKSGKDENIPLGHFSTRVIEVLRNEFGLKQINDQSTMNLKLTELHHIKLHHDELTADQAAGLVDVFYNPDWIGYSSGNRKGNLLRFLQENESGDNIGIAIYGGKNNTGYVKTFYVADSKDTLEKWKKSGIRLGPVANSDYQLDKYSRPGANPALIGPSTMPVGGKINQSSADVKSDSEKNPKNIEPDVHLSPVTDPELLKQLEAEEKRGEYLTLYRAAQLRDGKLYSPMAAKINGEWPTPIQLGRWEQADEHPELIVKGDKFKLDKGNGSSITAAYNPYIHSSETPLNDQFSSAWKRPELVTLEVRVPKSELTSGYHAEHAKDSVGMKEWKAGVVQGKLSGTRKVMLSRYDKPVRIVPDSEVAQKIAEMLKGTGVSIPENVVTPSLRAELERAGVKIEAAGAKNKPDRPNRTYKTYKAYKDSTRAEKREGKADSGMVVKDGEIRIGNAYLSWRKETDLETYTDEEGEQQEKEHDYILFEKIWVPKNERGRGIAKRLIPAAIQEVEKKYPGLDIKCSADPLDKVTELDKLVEFYERYGFRVNDVQGGEGIFMTRQANPKISMSAQDIRLSPATPEEAKEASDEVFRSEKDGIVNRIWDVAKIWKSPVVGEKKDVSAGASVLKNFYYQGKDVPTLGRVFEGGLRIDEFKNQAEHYMFNGNSGRDTMAEFAAWKKNNAAEYKRLNDYMVKTDIDRKADHVCRVAENSDHKWEVIAGNKKVLGKYGTEVEALEAAFQQEKNGLIADGWKPETAEWVYQIRNIFARQYEILAKDVKETEESLKDSKGEIPAEFVTVFTAIREMGDLRTTYFPRIRQPGQYLVYGTSPDGTEEMRKFDTKTMASIHAGKLKRAGYKVSIVRSNQSSEDVYSDLNVAAMNETLLHAADRLGNPEKLTWESIGFTPGEDHYKENSGKVVDYFTLKGYKSGYEDLMKKFGGQWFTGSGMWRFKRLYRNEKLQQGLLRALTLASGIVQSERDIMTKNIMAQTADVLRMHGSRSHMIKRSGKTGEAVVKGYEEDLLTAMHLSVLSVAGGYGKRNGFQLMMKAFMGTDLSFSDWLKEHAPEMVKNPLEMTADELEELGELHKEYQKEIRERMIDSAKQPHAYKLGMNFIKDMMRNETSLERSMGFYKSIAGLYFLSRPSSGIINLTTMAINVPAVMSDRLGISIPQAWKYIGREGKRFLQWKAGKLKPEGVDEYFYRRMVELGFGKAEMNKDVAGTVMTWGGRAWKKTMETGLLCFAKTEEFNRFVTTAAAFRVLLEQERAKLKPGETISNDKLDDLIRKANREVTLNAHGVYGKLGTPDIMRGGGVLQETAKSAYTYKNYQHNTWQMCWDYVCRGKWGQLAYVSGSSAAIAGLKASPAVALAFMVMGMAGGEPPEGYEEAFYRWINQHAGNVPERFARMGIGGFAGADLQGSMGMEIGVEALPKSWEDFLGAPYSFGKGVVKGVGALAEGDFYTASQKLLPSALAAPVRAINEQVNGIQRRGKPELYEGQPIQPDSVDMILRMLGFNPAAISEKREKNRTMRSVKNKLSQERSELRNDLRGWYHGNRSRVGYLDIFQKIQRYNELAKRYGEKEFTQKDIERAMK